MKALALIFLNAIFAPFIQGSDLTSLYSSLDPHSLTHSLAFYELYPDTQEGKAALQRARTFLSTNFELPVHLLVPMVNRFGHKELADPELDLIESLAGHFPNRNFKGFYAQTEAEMIALPAEEIDLGRALLLSQYDGDPEMASKVRLYSAQLDLIALQIEGRLKPNARPIDKIHAINAFIFEEMRFRFPPQSIYAKDIDLYTFLPSVMDNHLGVCLGVTALYLSVAQRLSLPLEIVTPPGHIYIRYREEEKIFNIETTAHGIDLPTEEYLNVNTRSLQTRTIKEVVGMTHVNRGSLLLHQGNFELAAQSYQKARPYMPNDFLVNELLGFSLIFTGEREEGCELLAKVKDYLPDTAVSKQREAEDFLNGKVDEEGIQAMFMEVDENRESILVKQKRLQEVLKKFPEFRSGIHQLAVTWLQLHRYKEAIDLLKRYHSIDPYDPTVEYYLAILHAERMDYKSAWEFLRNAEALAQARDFSPKALRELRKELITLCPE